MPRFTDLGSTTKSSPAERVRPDYAPEAKRRSALKLFREGFGYKAVATILGLSTNTVRDWGRAYKKGEFRVELSANQFRYTEETKVRVHALRERGLSWKEVSALTGVNISTCRAWVYGAKHAKNEEEGAHEEQN